jgi:hypothetical protein
MKRLSFKSSDWVYHLRLGLGVIVDELLHLGPSLQWAVREVQAEVCFRQLLGRPMTHSKRRLAGREERNGKTHQSSMLLLVWSSTARSRSLLFALM